MLSDQFFKHGILIMKEQYLSSISKEAHTNKIVDLFNQIYPICITLQAPLLSMKRTQSFGDRIDQHTFFTIKSDPEGMTIIEIDGFYFYDLIESIDHLNCTDVQNLKR